MNTVSKIRLLAGKARDTEGQTTAEYAVVLSVLTVGAAAVFTVLSGGISGAVNNAAGLI
jgi:Flp pilus assembly pilin Flp